MCPRCSWPYLEKENIEGKGAGLELVLQQDGTQWPSMLSGARCLSSSPHCPCDLVAKSSEFTSEARSLLTVALSSGGLQYMEELKVSGQRRALQKEL